MITPYKEQKRRIIRALREVQFSNIDVNTIDAFQGDEENVVIYCMTRGTVKTDYFSDSARLNVAFSRSKNTLIIIGSSSYMRKYGQEHILYKIQDYIYKYGKIISTEAFLSCRRDEERLCGTLVSIEQRGNNRIGTIQGENRKKYRISNAEMCKSAELAPGDKVSFNLIHNSNPNAKNHLYAGFVCKLI